MLKMLERLRTEIFPEAVETHAFGTDVKKFVSFEPLSDQGSDQFASDVMFGHVTLEKENGGQLTENVVIKVQPASETAHMVFDCDAQFFNEIFFYTKIIPALRKYDSDNILSTNFCKFIYGKATCGVNPKEDIIILESVTEKGFKLTEERLAIDEKHINLALDRIAKYHALSFKLQSEEPDRFQELISQIKPAHKEQPEVIGIPKNFLTVTTLRGVNALKDDPKYQDKLEKLLKHCENAEDWRKSYVGPSESLNVITHGDFCRNNMMFKHKNNGEPEEVLFFDLATIKYTSPIVDLSFFLALNTSPEARRLHWDEFLQTYYGALSQQLDGHPAKPSFEAVELEMRKKGIYGYYLCSFFLPSMMVAKKKEDWDEQANDGFDEDRLVQEGGPKATEALADLVRHMLDRNYIFDV